MKVSFGHWTYFFLYLLSHANVCSHDIVFKFGCSDLMCLKEYFSWQVASLWFLIWRASITLVISAHMYFRSPGSGSGSLATFRPSRWHMLSYANTRFCLCSLLNFAKAATNHVITKRNTWAGPSDLFVIACVCVCVCVCAGGWVHGINDYWLLYCVYMCVTVCVCVCVRVCIKVKALPYTMAAT